MRVLGVDFGGKRIGLAVGESEYGVTTARPNLAASGTLAKDAEAIARKAAEEGAEAVVVGLPVEPDGAEGRMARICRQLADRLRERGVEVNMVDERMTSAEAESDLAAAGMKGSVRKRTIDGEAARRILERWFSEQA